MQRGAACSDYVRADERQSLLGAASSPSHSGIHVIAVTNSTNAQASNTLQARQQEPFAAHGLETPAAETEACVTHASPADLHHHHHHHHQHKQQQQQQQQHGHQHHEHQQQQEQEQQEKQLQQQHEGQQGEQQHGHHNQHNHHNHQPVRSALAAMQHHMSSLAAITWDSGAACSLISAAVFALNALMVKLLHNRVPSTQIILYRSLISLIICAYSAYGDGLKAFFGSFKNYHLLFSRGSFGAASMQCLYLSIFMLPLADAVTLFFFNPAMTTTAAFFILRESVGVVGASGVLVSLGGLMVLTQPPFIFGHADNWDHQRTQGTVFGVLSAVFAAGAFISIRLIGNREAPLTVSVWFHSVALISCIIPLAIGYPDPAVWPNAMENLLLFVIGITSFIGQLTLSRGFQLQTAARASAINLTQVVWSYLYGLMFLHDIVTWMGVLGSVLIGAGAVLVNLKPKPKPGPSPPPSTSPSQPGEEELVPLRGDAKDSSAELAEEGRALGMMGDGKEGALDLAEEGRVLGLMGDGKESAVDLAEEGRALGLRGDARGGALGLAEEERALRLMGDGKESAVELGEEGRSLGPTERMRDCGEALAEARALGHRKEGQEGCGALIDGERGSSGDGEKGGRHGGSGLLAPEGGRVAQVEIGDQEGVVAHLQGVGEVGAREQERGQQGQQRQQQEQQQQQEEQQQQHALNLCGALLMQGQQVPSSFWPTELQPPTTIIAPSAATAPTATAAAPSTSVVASFSPATTLSESTLPAGAAKRALQF